MAGLPSRAGERCAVEQRHRTMTTCHQGRARNASALRPPQAAQPDGRAGCVAAKPPFSTANGGGSVHEPAGPAVCSLPTWRQSAGLRAARRRVAVCMDWLPAARAYTPPPSCPGQGGGKGVFDAEGGRACWRRTSRRRRRDLSPHEGESLVTRPSWPARCGVTMPAERRNERDGSPQGARLPAAPAGSMRSAIARPWHRQGEPTS